MRCPSCGTENPASRKFCGICGHQLQQPALDPQPAPIYQPGTDYSSSNAPPLATPPVVQKKYKALRVIAVVYKVLAFLVGSLCGLAALVALFAGLSASSRRELFDVSPVLALGGIAGAFIYALIGTFWFVTFYSAAEWILVFLDIEENTRATRMLLSRQQGQ